MSPGASPALIIRFPPSTSPATRDHLVAILADYALAAIQEDDLSAPRVWTAHFETAEARDAALAAVSHVADEASLRVETADVEDEDWARRTQADLPAIRVGRIIVAPPWDLPSSAPRDASPSPLADIVVEIEPSRGFGTGHHQSTRLCLLLLQARDLHGQTVLDLGTGSGVLAIAAARLGAAFVSAVDVDPEAVENARENIDRNHVAGIVEAHVRDLNEPGLPPADVVTANLTGTLLARYAPHIAPLVRPSGSLLAAGFTVDERALVTDAFAGLLDVSESAEEDDWAALVLTLKR